jgi:hypothetical protein
MYTTVYTKSFRTKVVDKNGVMYEVVDHYFVLEGEVTLKDLKAKFPDSHKRLSLQPWTGGR